MAREIVWSESAIRDRVSIYRFWTSNNKSATYSDRLEQLFDECARILSLFPELGIRTDIEGIRVKTIRNYKLFYRVTNDRLVVLRLWDSRQDPDGLRM